MSYFRNVRNIYDQNPWNPHTDKPNPYCEKYVQGKDKEFLRGFDWCTEEVVDNFFDNLDTYGIDKGSYIGNVLLSEVPEEMREEYEIENTFGEDNRERKRTVRTYADWLRYNILDWIETERNMLVTSMIDSMPEEEYKKAYDDFWKDKLQDKKNKEE